MPRPATAVWAVLDLSDDPTPGDPDILERLVAEYNAVADDAETAATLISRIQSADLGEGKSLDKLREKLDELPGQIGKLRDSYRDAADALKGYAPQLRTHQDSADRARLMAEEAQQQLDAANADLGGVQSALAAAQVAIAGITGDDEAAASAQNNVDRLSADRAAAQNRSDDATSRLNIAKRLAADAQELRVSDASTAVVALAEAEDNAVREKSFFEKIAAALGMILGVIGFVTGILGLILTGPIGFIFTAVSVLVGIASLGVTAANVAISGPGKFGIAELVLGGIATVLGLGGLGAALSGAFKAGRGLSHVIKNFNKPTLVKPPPRITVTDEIPLTPVPARPTPRPDPQGDSLAPPVADLPPSSALPPPRIRITPPDDVPVPGPAGNQAPELLTPPPRPGTPPRPPDASPPVPVPEPVVVPPRPNAGAPLGGPSSGHLNETVLGAIKRMQGIFPFKPADIIKDPATAGANGFGIGSGIVGLVFGGLGLRPDPDDAPKPSPT